MAVYLAAHHYHQYVRAVIGFEAPDRSPARRSRFFCHPQVNQAAHNPSYAYGLMSSTSTEVYRKNVVVLQSEWLWGVRGRPLLLVAICYDRMEQGQPHGAKFKILKGLGTFQ